MKNLISTLILGTGLVFGLNSCNNELKRNTEIELYDKLLKSYMESEDSIFQEIIVLYKREFTELKEHNKKCKKENCKYNDEIYKIGLEGIKSYFDLRELRKKEILEMSKKIKKDFDKL